MPNWKKVVVSGSDAILNTVTASFFTGSLTGALIGTASWANNAVTATQVLTQTDSTNASYFLTAVNSNNGTATAENLLTATGVLVNPALRSIQVQGAVTASTGFLGPLTGSVFGTASYVTGSIHTSANPALSSSYALSASYALNGGVTSIIAGTNVTISPTNGLGAVTINSSGGGGSAFPFTGSAQITGSLGITGSLIVRSGSSERINTNTLTFRDQKASESINWGDNLRLLYDNNGGSSVQWGDRFLVNASGIYTINWQATTLNDNAYNTSLNWNSRIALTPAGTQSLNYSDDHRATSETYYTSTTKLSTQEGLLENHGYSGHVIEASIDGETPPADYQPVFLDTDGTWYVVTNNVSGATKMLGVCVNYALGLVLLEGDLAISFNNSYGTYVVGADHGLPVYLSATANQFTTTQPTSDVVRIVGHVYYNGTTNTSRWLMKFKPSADWYVQ
ncbi:hypothetical protein UFOVP450_196 [uncultured Caudovirales phage]|uniref:Uncharacterized protein n=1 Tax=uncultured Caudovirales phage TaxID=2100421 RepID=A0A6J5MAB5_9CAUD|nr:hypothetical protein UFOVP450_196 [uncultured Caudovirales phage]